MTQLRILAPTVVDYASVPGATLRDPHGYARFWAEHTDAIGDLVTSLAPQSTSPPEVVLEHTAVTSSLNLYRTISDHAVERPMQVMTGVLRSEHLVDRDVPLENPLAEGIDDVQFRLYDHGLLLLELLVDLDASVTQPSADLPARLDELQSDAVALGEAVAAVVVHRYVHPLLDFLRRADLDNEILLPATPADDPLSTDFGGVLWVTRSLVINPAEPGAEQTLRHWIKDVIAEGEDVPPVDKLLNGELDHLVRWLNYVFIDRAGVGGHMRRGEPFADDWDALRYAQVFYGVLDRVDARLSKILADSAVANARAKLDKLKTQLMGQSQRAELIIMERRDVSKYLKRAVRAEMDAILDFWDYESVLEQSVRFKIETCDRRLSQLAAERAARAALFTDVILLGIGVTSILATAVALSEFGRIMANDPEMSVYDLGRSSLVQWMASQPADAIVIASGVASLFMVVLYLYFRRGNKT